MWPRETAAEENTTSYYPLLDRIAEGYFSKATTDEELYGQFIQVLQDDGHIHDAETLSTYNLALALRTSAPRIEAHYQFYHTAVEPTLSAEQDSSCLVWAQLQDKQYCSPALDEPHGDVTSILYERTTERFEVYS
jgi:UDP-glucose:glycoprotein glucosyltransferase